MLLHQHRDFKKPSTLQRYFLQSAIEFIKLVDLSDEKVSVSRSNLRVSDVDHVLVNVEVHLRAGFEFSLESRGSLSPDHILHLNSI